eukprot:5146396-Prymnesium_polylepis.1
MTTVTWLIGAPRSHTSQILARDAYFGPTLAPVRIWEEAVLGGPRVPSTGRVPSSVLYGTV